MISRKILVLSVALGGLAAAPQSRVYGQHAVLDWATTIGGDSGEDSHTITVDKDRNVISGGSFQTTTWFVNANDSFSLTSLGNLDAYIVKQAPDGTYLWARQLGGERYDRTYSVRTDSEGNIYAVGYFGGDLVINPGPDVFDTLIHPADNFDNVFITKLTPDGEFVWVRHFSSVSSAQCFTVAVDGSDNLYLGGRFNGTLSLGNTVPDLVSAGGSDGFLVKMNPDGDLVWAKQIGGANADVIQSVDANDKGDLYAVGRFTGTVQFDDTTLTPIGPWQGSGFVLRMDTSGKIVWARELDLNFSDVNVDVDGNVLTTGTFSGSRNFNPDRNSPNYVTTGGGQEAFILKLDPDGVYEWEAILPGTDEDEFFSMGIVTDLAGNIYTTGTFSNATNFNPDPASPHYIEVFAGMGSGGADVFIWKLGPDKTFKWVKHIGGQNGSDGMWLDVDSSGNIYSTGRYSGNTEFDPGPGSYVLGSKMTPPPVRSSRDVYVHKLLCTDTSSGSLTRTLCNESFEMGGRSFDATGVYRVRFHNTEGCDSIITLDLTIHRSESPEIDIAGTVLSVRGSSYASVQWIRNGEVLEGMTGTELEIAENGEYQVAVVTEEGCADTSRVYLINNVSVGSVSAAYGIRIYPNPVRESVLLDMPQGVTVRLMTVEGKLLRTDYNPSRIPTRDLPAGVYFLQFTGDGNMPLGTERIVKE